MDKYARFEVWLRENGARFDQLELREYDDDPKSSNCIGTGNEIDEEKKEMNMAGSLADDCNDDSEMRGVHANSHIPPNTLCMMIPRRCLITVEMGQATPIGQAIMSSDLDLDAPKHIFLMIYILWDRKVNGRKSFFYPYYDILPKTLRNMPIFWSEDELQHLQGSYLLHQIADRNAAIEDDYYSICHIAPLEKICTLQEFKWARMCVCSRNFGLQIDGHRTSALVPHADMLNHYRPRETKWTFDEEKQAFTITTLQYVQAGAEVFDSYGQKCNHRFLLNYGFAVEDNRELDGFCPNEVPVELYVAESDPTYAEKLEFWTRGEVASIQSSSDNHHIHNINNNNHNNNPLRQQHLYAQNNNNTSSQQQLSWNQQPAGTASTATTVASPALKRVRLCVANNENTRLLFSLLRTLACNEDELRAISSSSSTTTSLSSTGTMTDLPPLPTGNHPILDSHRHHQYSNDITRSLFGLSPEARNFQVQNHTTTNFYYNQPPEHHFHHNVYRPPSMHNMSQYPGSNNLPYHRSCRDIRHPISIRNEREAMRLLLQVVNRHLHSYPTTLQQDCADLQDFRTYPRFSNRRHAKIQVRGEKEVLHHYAAWARNSLEVLDILEEEINEELNMMGMTSTASGTASGSSNGVEVQLIDTTSGAGHRMSVENSTPHYTGSNPSSRIVTSTTTAHRENNNNNNQQRISFEYFIRQLQEDDSVHHTILRYCEDVLGSLRREEMKLIRRQQLSMIHHRTNTSAVGNNQSPPRSTGGSGTTYTNATNNLMRRGYM